MIPQLIHLWWHDPDPPPFVERVVKRWQAVHPEWTVHLWHREDELAPALAAARLAGVERRDRIRHAANLVRWQLLRDHGGVWVDTDATPLEPLDPLCAVGDLWMPAGQFLAPFVCGGPAGHPLWAGAVRASLAGTGTSPEVSGGRMFSRLAVGRLDLRRLPLACFARHDAAGRYLHLGRGGTRYSDHQWTTSRARHAEKGTR